MTLIPSVIFIFWGIFEIKSGSLFGWVLVSIGLYLAYLSKFEIISKRSVPGLPESFEQLPKNLKEILPLGDPIALTYLQEAIQSLKYDSKYGAAFMLGAASEALITDLIEAFIEGITSNSAKEGFKQKLNKKNIAFCFEEFIKSYKASKRKPNDSWANDIETILSQMFHYLRFVRNEIGHPKEIPNIGREEILSNLGQFAKYFERITMLKEYFKNSGVEL